MATIKEERKRLVVLVKVALLSGGVSLCLYVINDSDNSNNDNSDDNNDK